MLFGRRGEPDHVVTAASRASRYEDCAVDGEDVSRLRSASRDL